MHTRASNSELVKPLPEPEPTLNRRLHRQNRKVLYDQRNNPPQQRRIVYPPILNINYFRHFLDILRNYDLMDDEPIWAADRVVTPTPGSAITILKTAKEFSIKGNIIKIFYHGLNEITQEVLNTAAGGNSNFDTENIMARIDAMTIKIDAQYKELQSRAKQPIPDLDDDDIPMSREEEAKFMQTFHTFMDLKTQLKIVAKNNQASIQNLKTKFDRLAEKQSGQPSGSLPSNTQLNPLGSNSKAYQRPQYCNEHVNAVFTRSGKSYDPPDNSNFENPINFDSDNEDDEPTPQPKTQPSKPVKEVITKTIQTKDLISSTP
nr:reverse transcriptase domain-containing protein [Tanacetum cinerariifolium]